MLLFVTLPSWLGLIIELNLHRQGRSQSLEKEGLMANKGGGAHCQKGGILQQKTIVNLHACHPGSAN